MQFGYLEVNPLVTLPFSRRGIKMLIGTFMWFGTASGDGLRRYAIERGIPLMWAFNPTIATECGVGPQPPPSEGCTDWGPTVQRPEDPVAVRLVDPVVLRQVPEGHNFTGTNGTTAKHFESIWRAAATAMAFNHSFAIRMTAAKSLWPALLSSKGDGVQDVVITLGVEPIYAGACASEGCVGVRVGSRQCVCAPEPELLL
jgi:hypothetical protein